ncbi:MAG: hypothetical protein PHP22_00150 [Oscillospiraceae bacterium]|nr:hypothetical protein [Oscillospiraceae bacterium]
MPNNEDLTSNDMNQLSTAVRALVLGFFAIVLAVVSVSFAIHHMREGFEAEYRNHYNHQLESIAVNASLVINGDEIVADPVAAGQKYPAIINLMLPNQSEDSFSTIDYGLFGAVDERSVLVIYMSDPEKLIYQNTPIYKWRNNDPKPFPVNTDTQDSILVPILDSEGNVVALFELTGTHSGLHEFGNGLESKLLLAVIVSVFVGLILFSLQYIIPKLLFSRKRQEAEE